MLRISTMVKDLSIFMDLLSFIFVCSRDLDHNAMTTQTKENYEKENQTCMNLGDYKGA